MNLRLRTPHPPMCMRCAPRVGNIGCRVGKHSHPGDSDVDGHGRSTPVGSGPRAGTPLVHTHDTRCDLRRCAFSTVSTAPMTMTRPREMVSGLRSHKGCGNPGRQGREARESQEARDEPSDRGVERQRRPRTPRDGSAEAGRGRSRRRPRWGMTTHPSPHRTKRARLACHRDGRALQRPLPRTRDADGTTSSRAGSCHDVQTKDGPREVQG